MIVIRKGVALALLILHGTSCTESDASHGSDADCGTGAVSCTLDKPLDDGILAVCSTPVSAPDLACFDYWRWFKGADVLCDGITPGEYTVLIRGAMTEWASVPVVIEAEKTAEIGPVILAALSEQALIQGSVVDSNGQAIAGASVSFAAIECPGPAIVDTIPWPCITDSRGAFVLHPTRSPILLYTVHPDYSADLTDASWGEHVVVRLTPK